MTKSTLELLCRLPVDFHQRGDVSMLTLFQESGYDHSKTPISEGSIEAHLREHPDLVPLWVRYSEDQRCSPAWYVVEPLAGAEGEQAWRVGYFNIAHERSPERRFADGFEASAFFIMRMIEELSRLAG